MRIGLDLRDCRSLALAVCRSSNEVFSGYGLFLEARILFNRLIFSLRVLVIRSFFGLKLR